MVHTETERELLWGGRGGSMVVVSKSESCCYLLCGRLGSDLMRVFQCFSSGGGVGDTSDSGGGVKVPGESVCGT